MHESGKIQRWNFIDITPGFNNFIFYFLSYSIHTIMNETGICITSIFLEAGPEWSAINPGIVRQLPGLRYAGYAGLLDAASAQYRTQDAGMVFFDVERDAGDHLSPR
jgi:hypothetical protein